MSRDEAAAQQAAREAEAEALRIQALSRPSYPPVQIHLHCGAPGCWDLPSNHEEVWRWIYDADAVTIMRRLLTRLERAPAMVIVRDWHRGWTDILGSHPLVDDREFIALATICEGLSFEQIHEAHQSLIDAGWKPKERKAA
ncbi:hypothetical protein AEAC466_17225 [Asticcacaulis sp. AC466]|uniref:hypothetical protein n=1 Tax=Asticcacaulis sp. AC466 TaxID=1282362 RepID=UPI0003C3E01A|nr:hypothetical protein [Asticcacaulis sp. AC466]ESQ82365.1 hypothetical protein AEAC466_17225 [Asticcacaulis sp. AC466]